MKNVRPLVLGLLDKNLTQTEFYLYWFIHFKKKIASPIVQQFNI